MKNSKLFLARIFVFLLVMQYSPSFAQNRTITGTVFNAVTGKPISGVKVEIKGTVIATTSNSLGEYTLIAPDTIKSIEFSDFAGMKIVEIKIVNSNKTDIYLSEIDLVELSLEELMNVKVTTAIKQEQKISDIPASVVVVTGEDIKSYGYQSIPEILENVLGLFKLDDFRAESFGVRGFFSNVYNRTFVLLVNGVDQKVPAEDYNLFTLTNMQVEAIDRIEIVRGPLAISYGNNAFFGAINIITNKSKSDKSLVSAGYGSDNAFRFNVASTVYSENYSLSIAAGYNQTDGRNIPFKEVLDSVMRYDGKWIKDGRTKEFFKRNSYYFNMSGAFKNLYANFSYDESNRNLIHNLPPILDTTKNIRIEKILRMNLGYKKEISDKISFDARIDLVNYYENNLYEMGLVVPFQIKYTTAQLTSSMLSSEATFYAQPIDWLSVVFGGKISSIPKAEDITDLPPIYIDMTDRANEPIISHAIFAQFACNYFEKFHFIAGIRYDKQNKYVQRNTYFDNNGAFREWFYTYDFDEPDYIPQFAIIYRPTSRNVLKISFNQGISRPSYFENIYFLNTKHSTLVPQKIFTLELNIQSILSEKYTINTSIFYNQIDKLIQRQTIFDPIDLHATIDFNNSGKFGTLGGEIQILAKPINKLLIDCSFSYQNTEDKTYNIKAAYSPNILIYLKTVYNFNDNIILGLIGNYVGEMESFWDNSPSDGKNQLSFQRGRIAPTTNGYFNLGANLRMENLFFNRFSFNLHITNLLNEKIRYAPTTVNADILSGGTLDSGIQFNATLSLEF